MNERGLTATETARRMSEHLPDGKTVSLATISHYRTGRAIPRLDKLDALSRALEVEQSELISLSDSPAPQSAPDPIAPIRDNTGLALATRSEAVGHIGIEDFGDEVHLRIDQRVSWAVALKILDALKRAPAE